MTQLKPHTKKMVWYSSVRSPQIIIDHIKYMSFSTHRCLNVRWFSNSSQKGAGTERGSLVCGGCWHEQGLKREDNPAGDEAAGLLLLLFIMELLMSVQLCDSRHSYKTACTQVNTGAKIDTADKIVLLLRMTYKQLAVVLWPYLVKYSSLSFHHCFFFTTHVWIMCWGHKFRVVTVRRKGLWSCNVLRCLTLKINSNSL